MHIFKSNFCLTTSLADLPRLYLNISLSTLQHFNFENDYEYFENETLIYKIHADFAKTTTEVRKQIKDNTLLLNIL